MRGESQARAGPANLVELELARIGLSGAIPTELGNLTNLEKLNLAGNDLSGSVPTQLGSLSKLKELHLGRNQLGGSLPTQLGSLTKLEELNGANNQLGGAIPTELGNLTKMKRLFLTDNQLTGWIPSTMGDLTNLLDLYIGGNQLVGTIPAEMGSLTNLERVDLLPNQLSGCLPSSWSDLRNVGTFGLPVCAAPTGTTSPLVGTFTPSGSGTWSDPFIISNPISITAHSILSYVSGLSAYESVYFQWTVSEQTGSWKISIDASPDGYNFDLYVRDERTNNWDAIESSSDGDESVTVTVQADGHIYLAVRNTDGGAPTDLTLTIEAPGSG